METHGRQDLVRPKLWLNTPESEFLAWYWLKTELTAFCREIGLRTDGSKQELTARVAAFLAGREAPATHRGDASRTQDTLPECLTLRTVVTPGFRLSRKLRAFFEEHEGSGFHFNQALREFFREPAGRSLADALSLYRNSHSEPARPITAQFEYNRHMRDFFETHPGSSIKEARLAWWHKRNYRQSS
jgi:hypothetical protein